MAEGSFTNSSGSGSSKSSALDAGSGPTGAIIADALGFNTVVKNGQIVLTPGAPGETLQRLSDKQLRKKAKAEIKRRYGKAALHAASDKEIMKFAEKMGYQDAHTKKWEERNAAGITAEGPGGALTRNLLGGIEDDSPYQEEGTLFAQDAMDAQRQLFGAGSDQLAGLIEDGRPVDVQGLVNRGVTDLKEQFSGAGLTYGSDVQNQAVRTGAEMRSLAEENARQRQMGAIQLGSTYGQQGLQFGSMLGNLGAQQELQSTPWGRAMTKFSQIANPQPTAISSIGSDSSSEYKTKSSGGGFGF
jgi:hypothetical protein